MEKLTNMKKIITIICFLSMGQCHAQIDSTVKKIIDSFVVIRIAQQKVTTDSINKKIIDSTVTAKISQLKQLTDSIKVIQGQATITSIKNTDGSNTGTIDLTLLWDEVKAIKNKLLIGLTVTGTAK